MISVVALDHEIHAEYSLVIQAEEDQTPRATVVTSLTITITDENESPPVFVLPMYTSNISEHSRIGRAVLLIQATDPDAVSCVILQIVLFPQLLVLLRTLRFN